MRLRTFGDIVNAVREQLKYQASDTESINRIKRNLNTIYLNHVIPFKQWRWLNDTTTVSNDPTFNAGSAIVTQNSVVVTLTQAPATSRKGYYFSVVGSPDLYRIASHAAGSLNLVLETAFNGATNTQARFNIWTDFIPLPTICKEVIEVSTQGLNRPVQAMGVQALRRLQSTGGVATGLPAYYSTTQWESPSPFQSIENLPIAVSRKSEGLVKTLIFQEDIDNYIKTGHKILVSSAGEASFNGEFIVAAINGNELSYTGRVPTQEGMTTDPLFVVEKEAPKNPSVYRSLQVYPSLTNQRINLLVDYQINVEELINMNDEPVIPLENRAVLLYGTLWLSASRERDPEMVQENLTIFTAYLNRMAGKTEDSPERPVMRASREYLATKRRGSGIRTTYRMGDGTIPGLNGIIGAPPVSTGTPNTVAIFDENGYLIGSDTIDLSALEYLVGSQGGLSANLTPNTTEVINQWNATQYKGFKMQYQINRGAGLFEHGDFTASTDGSTVSYSQEFTAGVDVGVLFFVDIFAGNLRLNAITDAGATADLKYKVSML